MAVIYGPSKLGKTALWRSVIDEPSRITISCSENISIEDIYEQVLFQNSSAFASEVSDEQGEKQTERKSKGVALGKKDCLQATIGTDSAREKGQAKQTKYTYPKWKNNVDTTIQTLSGKSKHIIFENYHRLSTQTLKRLCIDLRSLSDNRINVIFVGIPEDPYKIISFNQELEGRVAFLRFTFWDDDDLKRIALGGSAALNAEFTTQTLDFITNEAAGSPFLMQFNCYIACLASFITERLDLLGTIDLSGNDYELAMKKWGVQWIGACQPICEELSSILSGIHGLGDSFMHFIISGIKSSKARLTLDLRSPFWPDKKEQIKSLLLQLNARELTRDLLFLDEKKGKLSINRPNFISYIRWIHK